MTDSSLRNLLIDLSDAILMAVEAIDERDKLLEEKLEKEHCEDAISRADVLEFLKGFKILHNNDELRSNLIYGIMILPSVTPKFTDDEIQKMQELEQAQLEKAYELGKAEIYPCSDAISRQAAIDVLTKTSGIRGDALKALYDLPPITPVKKDGAVDKT